MKSMNKLRATALSLLVMFVLALTVPLTNPSAHNRSWAAEYRRHMSHRHSRAWWRRYRARIRRKRAALARKRAVAAWRGRRSASTRQARATVNQTVNSNAVQARSPETASSQRVNNEAHNASPQRAALNGWRLPTTLNGAVKIHVQATDGRPAGSATLSLVSFVRPSVGAMALSAQARRHMLGGVPFAEFRRTVIDRMIQAGGWVINDVEREMGGRRVYVVIAQTPSLNNGRTSEQSWVFYFTEIDGRIYSLVTNSPLEFSGRMAIESERVMNSFAPSDSSTLKETSRR